MKSILFKPFLAKSIRDGNKTQTRRIAKAPLDYEFGGWLSDGNGKKIGKRRGDCRFQNINDRTEFVYVRPKYQIGETVYVKESLRTKLKITNVRIERLIRRSYE